MIGITEWAAAVLLIIGYFKPKAGILGGMILLVMFFTTSTMLITTPDDTVVVNGIHYMNNTACFSSRNYFFRSFVLSDQLLWPKSDHR